MGDGVRAAGARLGMPRIRTAGVPNDGRHPVATWDCERSSTFLFVALAPVSLPISLADDDALD
jgi:hypothetical protein